MAQSTIAVIGAGFSGTLLALHLLRHCPPSTRIRLIERNRQFGQGQAYSTGNGSHLLNVPAGRMSAFHDRPNHFLEWLQEHGSADGQPFSAGNFVSRRLYGRYVRSLLKEELRQQPGRRLELIRGDVLGIDRGGSPLLLRLDRCRQIDADLAILAIGNFPPCPPPIADSSFYDTPFYRADPWAPDALTGLDPADPVLLIGTGLTTVDVVISLLDQGHTGPILAMSRRGLMPLQHGGGAGQPPSESHSFPTVLTDLLRFLRDEANKSLAAGGSWQPIVDELRPFMQDVWQMMSIGDRRRFMRHARPWWDIHRHRMAASVADRIGEARSTGQFNVRAGRVVQYAIEDGRVAVTFRPRGATATETMRVARVVNGSGPNADYDRISDELIRTLLEEGTVRPDPLRLGLDVTGTCALLNRSGAISRRLFAVGPVTKGMFWEMTAVPDIRRQCEFLARHVAGLVKTVPVERKPKAASFSI